MFSRNNLFTHEIIIYSRKKFAHEFVILKQMARHHNAICFKSKQIGNSLHTKKFTRDFLNFETCYEKLMTLFKENNEKDDKHHDKKPSNLSF